MTQYSESPIENIGIGELRKVASLPSLRHDFGPCHLCAGEIRFVDELEGIDVVCRDAEYISRWCADGLIDYAESVYFKDVQRTGQWASDVQRRGAADFLCRAVAIAKRLPFFKTQIDEVDRLLEHDHRRVLDKAIRRIRELMPEHCTNRRGAQTEPAP